MWTESGWCFQAVEALLIISHLSEESNRKHGRLLFMKQCNGIRGRTSEKLDVVRIAEVSWVTVNMSKRLDWSFTQSWARRRSPSHLLQGHEEMRAVLLSLSSTSSVCFETTLSPVNKNVDALKLSGNDFENKCALS